MGHKGIGEAVIALERLTNDPNLRQEFSMQDAWDFLEGHVPAYSPADLRDRWKHPPDTVVEAFMCVDNPTTAAVNLALRALADEGVHVLCYHINTPDPDPLANAAAMEAAKRLEVDGTPTVLLNGRVVSLAEQDLQSPDSVLAALARADAGVTPRHVDVEVKSGADARREVIIRWPESLETAVSRADVYCVESAVLLNFANQCWLHGPVVRGQISQKDLHRTAGRLTGTLDPKVLRDECEGYARQVESELGITYRTIPTYIDSRLCSIVVKLYNRAGDVVAVGTKAL